MEKPSTLDFKGIILGGFIRNGLVCFGYGILFFVMTAGVYYGWRVINDQSEVSMIVQYLVWGSIFILGSLGFKMIYEAIHHLLDLRRFMFQADIQITGNKSSREMSADSMLDKMKDEGILYVNKNVMITTNYLVILKHDPTIYHLKHLVAAYKEVADLNPEDRGKKYENKIINFKFNKTNKVVYCTSIAEANDLLEVIKNCGKTIYPGRDSFVANIK
ncbi:MAG: hypothetical protein ACRCST_11365 [Turicibacter sp.]